MKRPVGVTILAIINGIQGLLFTSIGIAVFFVGKLILTEMRLDADMSELLEQMPPGVPEALPKVLGGIFLIIALANAVITIGLWSLRAWAWYLNLGLQALGIFGNLGGVLLLNPLSLVSIAFSGFYIYYFLQQPVQEAFGIHNAF